MKFIVFLKSSFSRLRVHTWFRLENYTNKCTCLRLTQVDDQVKLFQLWASLSDLITKKIISLIQVQQNFPKFSKLISASRFASELWKNKNKNLATAVIKKATKSYNIVNNRNLADVVLKMNLSYKGSKGIEFELVLRAKTDVYRVVNPSRAGSG